jgi:hypothetical protein
MLIGQMKTQVAENNNKFSLAWNRSDKPELPKDGKLISI